MKKYRTYIRTKWIAVCCCIMLVMTLAGCGKTEEKPIETTSKSPDQTVAIHAGAINVYLDEAKYYAYTAQATYETYFITEGKELNWEREMQKGVTWQQGVKSTVLDDICRRECMYALAAEYNISLTDEEESEIDIMVKMYYEETNARLMEKIKIEKERLKFVFEKDAIAKKVENIMQATDQNLPDTTYKNWKEGNTVTAEEQWQSITFGEPIFTLEDNQ